MIISLFDVKFAPFRIVICWLTNTIFMHYSIDAQIEQVVCPNLIITIPILVIMQVLFIVYYIIYICVFSSLSFSPLEIDDCATTTYSSSTLMGFLVTEHE